jgi:hypothetical protein
LVFLNINLTDDYLAFVFRRDFLQKRRNALAGLTPVRIKVNKHRNLGAADYSAEIAFV